MSLFVGNISRNVDIRDLEKDFRYYGSCTVNPRGSYGFVEFKNESDAEDAKEALNGKNYGGLPLIIEWSKRSGRFDPRDSRSHRDRDRDRHRYRKYSRSRSSSKKRKSKRSRSRSKDVKRRERSSPSYSPAKYSDKDSSKSSESRSKKRSRSKDSNKKSKK